jgi:hypothetical protein
MFQPGANPTILSYNAFTYNRQVAYKYNSF